MTEVVVLPQLSQAILEKIGRLKLPFRIVKIAASIKS
jgi:hypothetical protein